MLKWRFIIIIIITIVVVIVIVIFIIIIIIIPPSVLKPCFHLTPSNVGMFLSSELPFIVKFAEIIECNNHVNIQTFF